MSRSERSVARNVSTWFGEHARDLPWRTVAAHAHPRRDPYAVLVSEAMLQQTQVARVIDKYESFMAAFPTVNDLADADEQHVLALWSGLGYYRRAGRLHAAAKMIVQRFDGRVPGDVADLLKLPGVGRYTAGAIASIAFGRAEPIVDGNVARVLCRLHAQDALPDSPDGRRWLWSQAEALVRAADDPGDLNEGLMELGATVCTRVGPACRQCPLKRACLACAAGRQEELPRPRRRARQRTVHHASIIIERADRILVEQRADDGMWAGMWQAPTIESDRPVSLRRIRHEMPALTSLERITSFRHITTHRRIMFTVYRGSGNVPGRYVTPSQWRRLPLSNAQHRVLSLVGGACTAPSVAAR